MEARSTARREKCEMNFRNNLTAFSWKVFVTKSQCPDALTQKLAHLVFDQAWQPIIQKHPPSRSMSPIFKSTPRKNTAPPSLLR
jgi:hypothetical protein